MRNLDINPTDLKLLKEIYKDNLEFALKKLEDHYPIQYLIGYVDFYDTKINVNENVLIPRFETELVVDKAIHYLKNKNYKSIIDLCTGSGAIAIALKKNLNLEIDACDISTKALDLAKKNALENNVSIHFFKKDILNEEIEKKYDCIISNPPYVREDEYTSLETKYEPAIALFANHFGLEFYERILSTATNYLNKNGVIIFEIGAYQAQDIKKIALRYFPKANIIVEKDYNNFDRFMLIET